MGFRPGRWDIEYAANSALDETFRWTNNGQAVSLVGYSAFMQVRKGLSDTELLLDLTSANGRIVLGGALGTIRLTASPAVMSAVPAGVWRYDLYLSTGNVPFRFMEGAFTVRAGVTVL